MKTVGLVIVFILLNTLLYAQNSVMSKTKTYSVEIIRYTIAEGERKHFEEAYQQAGEALKASPYCLGYEVIHGVDEPQRYIVRIHWTSVDDHLSGFRKSKEFSSFFTLVRPFYNNIEEMKHYELTANAWSR
jgi:heme-degrading monooxygenase HmoA